MPNEMFSADLISPNDVKRMALCDPTILDFDIRGFNFVYIKPIEFKLVATQVTQARLDFLYSWRISLIRSGIPDVARHKIAEFLGSEHSGALKIYG